MLAPLTILFLCVAVACIVLSFIFTLKTCWLAKVEEAFIAQTRSVYAHPGHPELWEPDVRRDWATAWRPFRHVPILEKDVHRG